MAIGSMRDPDVTKLSSLEEFRREFGKAYHEWQPAKLGVVAGIFYRFISEMKIGIMLYLTTSKRVSTSPEKLRAMLAMTLKRQVGIIPL